MPEGARARWRELAVLVGGFAAGWAAGVWGVDEETADDWLGALRLISLLDWDEEMQSYSLHDLVREYAAGGLEPPRRHEAERRHARFFFDLLGDTDPSPRAGGPVQGPSRRLRDRALPNAEAGFAWAHARRDEDAEAADLCLRYPGRDFRLLRPLLARLTEADREILTLRYALDYPARQIADLLAVSVAAAESRLGRARQRLARLWLPSSQVGRGGPATLGGG